jgi:CRP-like cAMP-binding protein
MAIDALVRPLLDIAIFRGLKPLQLTEIVRRAERTVYRPGQILIEENAEADAAIVIVAGEAVRVSGPDLQSRAEPVPPGALLAELAMLIETQHTSTVVARSSVRALRLPRAEIHEIMAQDPDMADHFVQKIAGRLHDMHGELSRIYYGLDATPAMAGPAMLPQQAQHPVMH